MSFLGSPSSSLARTPFVDHASGDSGFGVPKGWHSRGYLPHLSAPGILQSVTFRLADSLPANALQKLEQELMSLSESQRDRARRTRIENWLDAGVGCCALRHPAVAEVVESALLRFDSERYRLLCWSVMPNHVHVLIEPLDDLGRIIKSWKSFVARWAMGNNNSLELAIPGHRFWMRDYWDRYIRNEAHLQAVMTYIHQNPVRAGLVDMPENWRWSSAWRVCKTTTV